MQMKARKQYAQIPPEDTVVYTTHQIATMLKVSPKLVSQWCDTGNLPHFRLPCGQRAAGEPGSLRRILRHDLFAFMKRNGIPEGIIMGTCAPTKLGAALVIGFEHNDPTIQALSDYGLLCLPTRSLFTAGQALERHNPVLVVLDADLGKEPAQQIGRSINNTVKLLAVVGEDCGQESQSWWLQQGYVTLQRPITGPALIESLRTKVSR